MSGAKTPPLIRTANFLRYGDQEAARPQPRLIFEPTPPMKTQVHTSLRCEPIPDDNNTKTSYKRRARALYRTLSDCERERDKKLEKIRTGRKKAQRHVQARHSRDKGALSHKAHNAIRQAEWVSGTVLFIHYEIRSMLQKEFECSGMTVAVSSLELCREHHT